MSLRHLHNPREDEKKIDVIVQIAQISDIRQKKGNVPETPWNDNIAISRSIHFPPFYSRSASIISSIGILLHYKVDRIWSGEEWGIEFRFFGKRKGKRGRNFSRKRKENLKRKNFVKRVLIFIFSNRGVWNSKRNNPQRIKRYIGHGF